MYLQMKLLTQLRVILGLALLCSYPVYAGDKIITSDDKLRGDPTKDLKVGNDALKSRVKIDESGPDLGISGGVNPNPVPLSKKERQMLKDRQAEKQNWLLLAPGELTKKHEQESSLGVENNPIDRLDAENEGPKDYTFHNIGQKKSGRQPGEIRALGQTSSKEDVAEATRAAQEQRAREDAEDDSRRTKPTFSLTGSTEAQASHTSSELNLGALLQPDQKEAALAASAPKGEFSLRDLAAPARTKEQEKHAVDFNNMLSRQSSLSLPVTAGPSLSSLPSPGLAPRPPEATPTRSGFDTFSQNPAFNAGQSRLPSTLPGYNTTPGFNPASPYQPYQIPAAQNPSKSFLTPIQPMQRKF